ncbi:MAG TPA: hypothetical protein VMY76_15930 [Gemmatimonadales bacterium]|nr:hypothetical protein [Gemmatimonadales bacterium]
MLLLTLRPFALTAIALVIAGCRPSKDVSGHSTYLSQPGDAAAANATARDTAADSAAPRVRP